MYLLFYGSTSVHQERENRRHEMNTEGGVRSFPKGYNWGRALQVQRDMKMVGQEVNGHWDRKPQSAADAHVGKTHDGTLCFEKWLARYDVTETDGVSLGRMDEWMHDAMKEKQSYSVLTKKRKACSRHATWEVAPERCREWKGWRGRRNGTRRVGELHGKS